MGILLSIVGILVPLCPAPQQATTLDEFDRQVLQVCEGIIRLFEQSPTAVWPGYDLAARPLVVYRANRWALLFGYEGEAEGFGAYPADWPDLNHPAQVHLGPHETLVGQLVFDFPIGDTKGIAVGVPEDVSGVPGVGHLPYEAVAFGHIVHEAFHQYQNEEFGDIPWAREERYPILDVGNSALACLEMRLLSDALRAAQRGDRSGCEELVRQFVAVRRHRWKAADSSAERFERGLELREGTAKYVEVRAVELAKNLKHRSEVTTQKSLGEKLAGLSSTGLLLKDFESRLTGGAIAPDDMPRNRVYFVGGTQCYLLDLLGIDWKSAAQRAGADFSYVELLQEHLRVAHHDLDQLVTSARQTYAYDKIVAASKSQIHKYRTGFDKTLAEFEAQPGQRVEVMLSTNDLSRSRVSRARKWFMDAGQRSLCSRYKVYVLTRTGIRLEVKTSGILELNDWEARTRTAVFYARGNSEITLDGDTLMPKNDHLYHFDQLGLLAENVSLKCSKPGTLRHTASGLLIDLHR